MGMILGGMIAAVLAAVSAFLANFMHKKWNIPVMAGWPFFMLVIPVVLFLGWAVVAGSFVW